jgi:hypothetical protein
MGKEEEKITHDPLPPNGGSKIIFIKNDKISYN